MNELNNKNDNILLFYFNNKITRTLTKMKTEIIEILFNSKL